MDLKSTFENLKDRATEMAQAGVAQSKRLAEIAKLKTANMAEEDAIKKAYIEIGKLYYAEQGASPDGAFVAACERITASKAAIEPWPTWWRLSLRKTSRTEFCEAGCPSGQPPFV